MKKNTNKNWVSVLRPTLHYLLKFLMLFAAFWLIEILCFCLLKPESRLGLGFGGLWVGMLAALILLLPRKAGRIVFGILYFPMLLWALAQAGYYEVFDKMMWLSTIAYAGEGAGFLGDVLSGFPFLWWIGLVLMIGLGVIVILKFPHTPTKILLRLPYLLMSIVFLAGLIFFPRYFFADTTKSEYYQSSSWHSIYTTMYEAKRVYDITGIYQMTVRDIWVNELYPLTPSYRETISKQTHVIDDYFSARGESTDNQMTGTYAGKNVVLVLMESMDDWMITWQDTPTIRWMMEEGINFTNFYTPGYGSARTLNSEFCMNTGIYLPTTGSYVFDYITNSYKQSIASQMTANGYNAKVFHYNDDKFYSRGVFEPAIGYEDYVSYSDFTKDKSLLYQDNLLFDMPQISDIFFREGPTLNTIITCSAHLSYIYREYIGQLALQKYPEYKGLYGSEEEDCARVKAKIVDDMFARLLQELESRGQIENTVIIAMTDHYTYGYKNMDELYAHSGVSSDLLLEKTPCFIWSADGPSMEVDKVLNTSDFLPTVLNLLGIDSPYSYLGQDAFDPDYKGYALFPDGSWICDGVAWQDGEILMNEQNRTVTQAEITAMEELSKQFRNISNLLLTANYYK